MIYLNKREAAEYMSIPESTFRMYRKIRHQNQLLIPDPSKKRTFPIKGRTSSKLESIWSRNSIDNAITRISRWKESKKTKAKMETTPKSKRALDYKKAQENQEARIAEIFNSFMNIRRKTA